MADELSREAQELIVLQRQSLATVDRIARAISAPRQVRVTRDASGAISGAVSVIAGSRDDEDEDFPEGEPA